MTIVVLLVLVLMWVVVLTPSFLRNRAERHGSDSIGAFHQQLGTIRRASPVVVSPANRLRSGMGATMGASVASPSSGPAREPAGAVIRPFAPRRQAAGAVGLGYPGGAGLPASRSAAGFPASRSAAGFPASRTTGGPASRPAPAAGTYRPGGTPGASHGRGLGRAPVAVAHRRTLQRRRQTLLALVGAVGLTLVGGLLPGLRILWAVAGICGVLLVAYLAMLIRLRSAAAEREMKLSFLPGPAEPAYLLRRSAN